MKQLWKAFQTWRYLRLVKKVDDLYMKIYGKTRLDIIIEDKLKEMKIEQTKHYYCNECRTDHFSKIEMTKCTKCGNINLREDNDS